MVRTDNIGLGVGIKRDGAYIVGISVDGPSSARYPYDCAASHCTLDSGSCDNICCLSRITARILELTTVVQALENDTKSLEEETKRLAELACKRWGDKIDLQTVTEIEGIGYFHSSHECPGCTVETLRRKMQAGRLMTALLREKLRAVKEHIELREREEAHEQDRLKPLETDIADLRQSASELRQELESLDENCEHTEIDRSTRKSSTLSESFSRRVESALSPEQSSNDKCSCKACLAKKKGVLLNSALTFGEASKKKLEGIVHEAWNGPGSLNYEREQTRRQAAQNTQLFGRVGSYRGHGAGALKTRERQMNPQTKGGKK